MVVTGAAHRDKVVAQVPQLDPNDVIAEPARRESMAAIGLAAALIERRDPQAIIGSFAADQLIDDAATFQKTVREAVRVAATGKLVTIGIEPTAPSTAYGYIRCGTPIPGTAAHEAQQFVEKPTADVAARYLATGEYKWNAGMFVVRAALLLDLLERWHPDLAKGLRAIAADPETLEVAFPELEKIAIDTAIAEPAADAGLVAVVPGSFGWDDIGDFASLAAVTPHHQNAPRLLGKAEAIHSLDATGLVFAAKDGGKTYAVVGIENVVVVDTGDALLITTIERAQDVKKMVDHLKADGLDRLL